MSRVEALSIDRQDAARTCPEVSEILVRIADLSDAMGAYGRAQQACRRLGTAGRIVGEVRFICARPLLARGELDAARDLLRARVAEEGADPVGRMRTLRAAAALLESRARPGLAADFLAEAATLAPEDAETALRHLRDLLEAGRDPEAVRVAEAAERRFAGDRETLRAMVLLLARHSRTAAAARAARVLLASEGLAVADVDAVVVAASAANEPALARAAADALRSTAPRVGRGRAVLEGVETLRRHGQTGIAAAFLSEALDRGEVEDPDARRLLGTLRGQAGDRDGAAAAFEAYLAARKHSAEASVSVAREWGALGEPARAVAVLRAATDGAGPVPVDVWLALGRALHETRDETAEHAAYRDAAARSSDPAATWLDVAEHLLGRGDAKGAADAFREAVSAAPDAARRARASAGLAEALMAGAGDRAAVEKALMAALETGTQEPEVLGRVERVASRVGDNLLLRIAVLESGVRRDPKQAVLWQRLAAARLDAGRVDESAQAYERYVETSTDRPTALAEAVTQLIRAGGLDAGLGLAGKPGNRGVVNPPLALEVGEACLSIGDVACAARFLKVFLAGPMVLDYDHETLARSLAAEGLTDLALGALDRASRVAAPDRRWEVEVQAGRVLLLAGKASEAEVRFVRALEASGKKRGVPLRVAKEMQALGFLARAASWYARAVADPDEAVRLQAVPPYIDCLWRLGREDALRTLLGSLSGANWKRAGPLQTTALAVAATGRAAEAAALVRDGRPSVREDERAALGDLEGALWLRAGRLDDALARARETCGGGAGDEGDLRCLSWASRLDGADRPELARDLLAARVADGNGGAALRADLSIRLLRLGDRVGGLQQAKGVVTASPPVGMVLGRLGAAFRDAGLDPSWADLVKHAPPAANGSDASVAGETARALLAAGDVSGAAQATETFLAARRGGEGTIYIEWVRAGHRGHAEALLARARDDSLAEIDARDLMLIAEDLARAGRDDLLNDVLERYRRGNEGIAAADETVGRILGSLGRFGPAGEALARVPAQALSDEGRASLMMALWRTGRKEEAVSVGLSGFDAEERKRGRDDDRPWGRVVLAFFLSEGAATEALAILDRALEGPDPSPAIRLLRARLRLRTTGTEGAGKARREFIELLPKLDGASDEVFRYVRDEVRAGRGSTLTDELASIRGARAAESRFLAACLVGRRDRMEDARKALTGEEPAGPRALLAAARASFECGRWEEALPLALRALKTLPRDADPADAARIALTSGRMLGRHAEKTVEEMLAARTEDPAQVQQALAAARADSGDEGGRARALLERTRWFLADPAPALEAVEAALRAGDGALRKEAEARALAATDDRPGTRRRLADVLTRGFRDDLAAEALEPLVRMHAGDDSMAGRRLIAFLRAGGGPAAARAATEYVGRHGNRRQAAAAVVSTAAGELAPDLVRAWIPVVAEGPADVEASNAMWQAAVMAGRIGRMSEAETWSRSAANLAPDGLGLRVRAAQAVLADPSVPASLLDWVKEALGARANGPASPAEQALACGEAATVEAASQCVRGAAGAPTAAAGLVAAGDRAMAAGRHDVAGVLMVAADAALGGSAVLRRAVGSRLLSYLGEAAEAPLPARRALGARVLEWVEADLVPRDADGGALRGHLSEMAQGLRVGVEAYEREVALAPADGSLRNNLGYMLSMAGGDLERAQREALAAVVLSPRGAPYYLETAAWARFLHEGPGGALPLQEQARRAWTVDQGGGVSEGFYHLGRMLEAAGRIAPAREAYRRAAVLEPSDWSGVRALRRWVDLDRLPTSH